MCTQNLKNKYLIGDKIRAKCDGEVWVELVDSTTSECVTDTATWLPPDHQLRVQLINNHIYDELYSSINETKLTTEQLRTCMITSDKPLLLNAANSSSSPEFTTVNLQNGHTWLDMSVTTSSEALLAGKSPKFRLLARITDAEGNTLDNVTYCVSESFVVATKRVKSAIKSDIPNITDPVCKLKHIGQATIAKLKDMRASAMAEGADIRLPDNLNCIDQVGKFRQLVQRTAGDMALQSVVRSMLKLSPERWKEVSQHAMSSVVSDLRHRVWRSGDMSYSIVFQCENGAANMDRVIGIVEHNHPDKVVSTHNLSYEQSQQIPLHLAHACVCWYKAGHPGWSIWLHDEHQLAPLIDDSSADLPETKRPCLHLRQQHSDINRISNSMVTAGSMELPSSFAHFFTANSSYTSDGS
jgi:hypothetical protein